jgi:hypothetical protein
MNIPLKKCFFPQVTGAPEELNDLSFSFGEFTVNFTKAR